MKKHKLTAFLLAVIMVLQVSGLTAFAEQELPVSDQTAVTEENNAETNPADEPDDGENNTEDNQAEDTGEGVFNFTAAKYVISEADESYEIKVERLGNADAAADVVFKAIDVLAVYGEDYTILDENGAALEKTEGTVIAPDELARLASEPAEAETDETTETAQPKHDIFEARNALLGVDSENQDEQEQVADEVTAAVETLNNDLSNAEGVSGILHFAEGETEKAVTVVPVNNDKGETDKTVLMALLGASSGSVAPNATTTLVIMDDEEYIPPVFEMAQNDMTLDAQDPAAELTVVRTSGEDYYSTVFVSTYSRTAKSGDDFTAIENEQLVFAPGETEKTFSVEALAFDQSGDFGVRIKSDGSCEIGENDRTIVHIKGEKSEQERVETSKNVTANTAVLQSAENGDSSVPVSEDGVVGNGDFVIRENSSINRKGIVQYTTRSYRMFDEYYKVGDNFYANDKYYEQYIQLNLTYAISYPSSVTVKFTTSNASSNKSEFIAYWGPYDSAKTSGYNSRNKVQKIPFYRGTRENEVTMPREVLDNVFTIVLPSGFSGNVTIDEIKLHFKSSKSIRIYDVETVETQPLIDLDNDWKADQLVNYTPPKPALKTENDIDVTAVYPSDEMIRVITEEEELMKHGIVLNGGTYGNLYNENRIEAWRLFKQDGYVVPRVKSPKVNVHLQTADGGDTYIHTKNDTYKEPFEVTTGTILRGSGYAAAGKVITGYDLYAAKLNGKGEIGETKFLYTYQNPKDASLLGGYSPEEWFQVPAIQEDGDWTEVLIVPKTEIQNLVVKPHPSTKNETIYEDVYDGEGNVIGQREVTYEGRAYLNRTFDGSPGENDTYVADKDGQVYFEKINSGSVFTLRSISPIGYLTEWVNGTMDLDGDGVIDNDQAGDMSQVTADNLYVPVYGNQFVYQANQSSPQYYYRFTKFDPSRLLNGKTRVGYVKKDKRTILEYNGKEASYKDYIPCPGATVQIGENTAVTDDTGRFEIPMDGVPDAVRVSAAVTTDSGNFITHVQSNVENNIFIPFYDTFEPQKVTAAYENEAAVSAPGIKVSDKELTVTVKVMHSANSMYIKKAGFYITDSSGKKVVDCNMRAEKEKSNYKVSYTNDGTFGYAELKMKPSEDMLSGYKIYVYFIDQNGTEHRALNTGHRFIETLDLGTLALGAIGSSSVADATTEVVDLLGAPLFDLNLGNIKEFTTTTGIIEPDVQLLDVSGNKMYEYDATLYSYRYDEGGFGNWSGGSSDDKDEGDKPGGDTGGDKPDEGSGGDTGGDSGNDDEDASNFQAQHGEILNKMKQVSSFDPDEVESEEEPKGADMSNGKKGVTKNSEYNFELTPSIRFDLITTARPAGKDKDGNDIYKHYFEEMSLGVGLGLDVNSRTEISLPIGISFMIKPSLKGSIEAVYYMKTDYGDDKYWTKRPIEYSPESFGLFKDYGDGMYRAGYILLNPKIIIAVGVKVAIVEVDVSATFDFDMDFKFDSNGDKRTYGNMVYEVHINVILLKMSVYSKKLTDGEKHLFGEDEPIGDGGVSLMSASMSEAVADAMDSGDTTVKPVDRSYLDDRSEWQGENPESKPFLARLFGADEPLDEDNPADRLLQKGVMTGDEMDSAMLDTDVMFTAYVDDEPSRGANDRSCLYYTYTNDDGSWTEPTAIEDDGTLDKDPVVYDMGDKLFVAWLTAKEKFDGAEDSLETVRRQLNSLNIHAAFFDKATKTFGEIFEVTKNTEDDWSADGNIAVTATADGIRVYYTKTQYLENPENVNELIATSSVIAYRDYENGAWSEEYTEEERQNIENSGLSADDYTEQWYGQRFEDTQINGKWPLVTDLEADIASDGAWDYFAFIADEDGSYETSSDRKIYFNFDAYNAPVCITPEAGAYDDLQFVYSGEELIMTFKSTQDTEGEDGEIISTGGISYINLSEVFEKQGYTAVKQADGTYQMKLTESEEDAEWGYYTPETALVMNGVVQKYEVFADRGGRVYLMWTDNTLNDDGTGSIQIYASVYNGKANWVQGIDQTSGYYGARWSHPVMLTSPMQGSYDTFTAQSITGDGIAFAAKRTNLSDETEMVFHLRAPHAVFTFNEDLLSTQYAYIGVPVSIQAEITNVGLKGQKTRNDSESGQNTWVALPGVYQIKIERLVDGNAVETLSESEVDTIWNVGDTIYANCEWTPEELPDNMDLRVSVTDKETGEEICSELIPVVKAAEVELGQVDATSEAKNEAVVSFDVLNKGNIPAELTAVISIITGENEKTELTRAEIGEVAAAESKSQEIYVPIDEKYQTIDAEGGNGSFKLQIDIVNGDETVYSTPASGAVLYSPEAIADVKEIESLSVEQTSLSLKKDEKAQINAALAPASAAENNKVIYVSSDENVATVNQNGEITAVGKGSATITAYAVSKMEFSSVQPDGSTKLLNVKDFIPDSMVKSQEIKVNVSGGSGSTGGGGGGTSSYTVTFDSRGGSKIDSIRISRNSTVKEPENPTRDGYTFGGWYTDKECTQAYDFSAKVTQSFTLYAKWTEGTTEPSDRKNQFTDVKDTDWFYGDVQYAHENNLFEGISDTEFGPNNPMTRAMLVTVLYRAEGEPSLEDEILGYPFADVDAESWYGDAVYWARLHGIVNGYSDEEFAPDQEISREQIAAIMERYADFKGIATDEEGDLTQFADASRISDWAKGNVQWAVGAGLISGRDDGTVDPLGNATRAEVAAILHRFMEANK